MAKLIIEIIGDDVSVCLANGEAVSTDPTIAQALADCRASGDCQPACEYVRDVIGVEWHTVALNGAGGYENLEATAAEKEACARAIYFDSESDFSNEETAEMYLIWEAASQAENEEEA